jgi:hypothetical protein
VALQGGPGEILIALALAFLAMWGFAGALTRQYTFDAIAYAWQIERFHDSGNPNWLLHPHHLIYNPLAYLWWRGVHGLPGFARSLDAQQLLSAVAGGAAVALAYIAARQGTGSRMIALGLALLLWACFGLWLIATDGAIYALGLAFWMAAIALGLQLLERPRPLNAVALGAVAGLAVLVHQMHLLLAPAVIVAPVLAGRTRWEQARLLLLSLGVGSFLLFGGYALAADARDLESAESVWGWLTAYGRDGRWWDFDIAQNVRKDVEALARVLSADADALVARIGPPLEQASAAHGIGLVLLLPALLTRGRQMIFSAFWLLPYAAFFTIWVPGYYAYWVPIMFGLLLTAGLVAEGAIRALRPARFRPALGGPLRLAILLLCGIAAAMLAARNRPLIEQRRQASENPHLMVARELAAYTRGADGQGRASDLLLIAGTGHFAALETYVPYFASRNLVTLASALKRQGQGKGRTRADALKWLEERVQRSWQHGADVYLFPDVRGDRAAFASLKKRYGLTPEEVEAFLRQFDQEYAFTAHGQPVYRLRRPRPERLPVVVQTPPAPEA